MSCVETQCDRSVSPSVHTVVVYDAEQRHWLRFENPVACVSTHHLADVTSVLARVQRAVEHEGLYAAGFVSYEASPAFDSSLTVRVESSDPPFPLVWFGLYAQPRRMSDDELAPDEAIALEWSPSIGRSRYHEAIRQIKSFIAQGDTYQVNFSFRLQAEAAVDPWAYFRQLIHAQQGHYSAFIRLADWAICCASPELFFRLDQTTVMCRPMKGTAPRGLTYGGDRQQAEALRHSHKNQAENVMIVDMIRNDLGRIAQTGSVTVPRLFEVEQYPTLWQMTSPVEAQTQASLPEILQALFPCASITGAPKARTMQIIAALEDTPRRLYTGTIGFWTPQRTAQFNVAIRTVLINLTQQTAEYGVGGGIVWDSDAADEYDECCTKAKILTQAQPPFDLLESLLWTPTDGYFLRELHLQRLQQSAAYFAFALHLDEIDRQLEAIAQSLPATPHKVRLRVSSRGATLLEATPLEPSPSHRLRVGLACQPIHSSNVFLYHKTTHRLVYDQMRQTCPEWDDVLLWNERGEVTESCIANVMVELDGRWYTPPVHCGLLAGTYRAWLLAQGTVQERVIYREDLARCDRLRLINSVRQVQEAVLEPSSLMAGAS